MTGQAPHTHGGTDAPECRTCTGREADQSRSGLAQDWPVGQLAELLIQWPNEPATESVQAVRVQRNTEIAIYKAHWQSLSSEWVFQDGDPQVTAVRPLRLVPQDQPRRVTESDLSDHGVAIERALATVGRAAQASLASAVISATDAAAEMLGDLHLAEQVVERCWPIIARAGRLHQPVGPAGSPGLRSAVYDAAVGSIEDSRDRALAMVAINRASPALLAAERARLRDLVTSIDPKSYARDPGFSVAISRVLDVLGDGAHVAAGSVPVATPTHGDHEFAPVPPGLVEQIAARVHEAWMRTKAEQGVTSRRSESEEELMVPYEQLSEPAKELDRASVRAVLHAALPVLRIEVSGGSGHTERQDDLDCTCGGRSAEIGGAEHRPGCGEPGVSDDQEAECANPQCVQIAATASDVYCDITGGLLSYPTYDARTVLAYASAETDKLVESETAELRAEVGRESDPSRARLAAALGDGE